MIWRTFEMPQIGFGYNHIDTEEPIYEFIRYGYTNIDTAAYYENEKFMGHQVKIAYGDFCLKRSDFFISTKVFNDMMGHDLTMEEQGEKEEDQVEEGEDKEGRAGREGVESEDAEVEK